MLTAVVVIVVVVGLIAGLIFNLRSSAKTGMPSDEVLKRATQHARDLDAQEKAAGDKRGD
jgi:hypothetical protein